MKTDRLIKCSFGVFSYSRQYHLRKNAVLRVMEKGFDKSGLMEVYLPRLIIVRGNSGSGKSSVAKSLKKQIGRNTLIIPQDTVRREMLWAHDGSETTALPLLINLLEYGCRNSEITILEGILKASWYQPLFERAIQLFEDSIFAYYF